MNCSRCGAEVQPSWKACPSCGLALSPTTPVQALLSADVTEYDVAQEALAGEYELIEELGRGGMAIVYRARELQLDREVAVKVLPFSLAFDKEFVERFEREARTAAQLEHPNIIPIYRVGQSGRVSYFVMKFLRGQSLSGVLAERGRLPPADIRKILEETASALGYAAERGIVHRDVKPDNFIFDEFGACVVTDFGIAKAASGKKLTGTGMSIGTPHYMSPEQARAQHLDGRSDLYSLGIVAYQCLTGSVPYDGEDSFSIGYAHIMDPIPTPTLPSPEERRLYRIIRGMIAKDPADRFQSCGEVIQALRGEIMPPEVSGRGGVMSPRTASPASADHPTPPRRESVAPLITTQPTTPLPSLETSGTRPGTITATPRRARRAARARPRDATAWWLLLLLLLGGGGTGAAYYRRVGPFAVPQPDPAASGGGTSGLRSAVPMLGPIGGADSSATGVEPAAVVAGAAVPDVARDTADRAGGAAAAGEGNRGARPGGGGPGAGIPALPSRDSGAIRIRGLPAGSAVLIDGQSPSGAVTYLPVGRHVIAITAPRRNFYADTVDIRFGEIMVYEPVLTAMGEPLGRRQPRITRHRADCENPRPGYNRNNVCFDVRPRPVPSAFITIPSAWAAMPSPSRLLVKVSAGGKALEVRALRPSNNDDFEALARRFAASIDWHPATKGDRPVTAWTQWEFRPARP